MNFRIFAIHSTGRVLNVVTDAVNNKEAFIRDTMAWTAREGYTSVTIVEL